MALAPKQRLWLHYYLTEANFNATEAARLAGYSDNDGSARVQGARLLANATVQEAVREAIEARAMGPQEIVARLSDMARASLDDFVTIQEDGSLRLDMQKARTRGMLHTFETIKHTKYGLLVTRYSALDALDKLARVHKLFGDQQTTIDVRILNVVLDALPEEYRAAVCEALSAEFQVAGGQIGGAGPQSGGGSDHPIGPVYPHEG